MVQYQGAAPHDGGIEKSPYRGHVHQREWIEQGLPLEVGVEPEPSVHLEQRYLHRHLDYEYHGSPLAVRGALAEAQVVAAGRADLEGPLEVLGEDRRELLGDGGVVEHRRPVAGDLRLGLERQPIILMRHHRELGPLPVTILDTQ